MKCLKVDEYVQRTSSVEETEVLLQELQVSLTIIWTRWSTRIFLWALRIGAWESNNVNLKLIKRGLNNIWVTFYMLHLFYTLNHFNFIIMFRRIMWRVDQAFRVAHCATGSSEPVTNSLELDPLILTMSATWSGWWSFPFRAMTLPLPSSLRAAHSTWRRSFSISSRSSAA